MFRHKKIEEKLEPTIIKDFDGEETKEKVVAKKDQAEATPEVLRELLEKNLKWSQIIYEQNRRINRKLFWYDLASWLRILIIVVPVILAIIFLPPIINEAWGQYQNLLGQAGTGSGNISPGSLEKFLKLLPLDAAKQQQLENILK